jgi:hypothetical protein
MNVQGTGTNLRPVDSYGGSMRNSNSYGGTNVVQPIVSTNTYASNVAPYNQSQPFINTNTNIQNTSYVQPQGSMNSGIQNTSYNQPQVVNTNSYSSDQNAAPYSQPRSIVI